MQARATAEGLLVLEDGSVFAGQAVSVGTRFGEVVFNTSMTGYQEILTDPSYCGQIVVMTQPHIGNYGVSSLAEESLRTWVEGFVARRFTRRPSSHGSVDTLVRYLREAGVPAVEELDTRAVVRRVREGGALRGALTTERTDIGSLLSEIRAVPPMQGSALVESVTCAESYAVLPPEGRSVRCRLAVYDFGVKRNILRELAGRGAEITVLPASTSADDCLAADFDGIVLSNGPGDPEPLVEIIDTVRRLVDSGKPVFGICLGHQLLGLALGAKTFKLKFGHHGGNQPVRDVVGGRVRITSQNHGFAIDPATLPRKCRISALNLNDGTVEGFVVEGQPVFATQYHPEAAPGPHDAGGLFDQFLAAVRESLEARR